MVNSFSYLCYLLFSFWLYKTYCSRTAHNFLHLLTLFVSTKTDTNYPVLSIAIRAPAIIYVYLTHRY